MLDQEITACCKALRLSQTLAERAQTIDGNSHQEYIYQLLTSEIKARDENRKIKQIQAAGFPKLHSFSAFRFDEVQLPSDVTPEQLASLDFIEKKMNIVMYGRTGTGKTMLSTALGVTACHAGMPVRFFRTAALINQLSEAKKAGTLGVLHRKLNKATLLILDEFGYVPYDRTGSQLLFDYLSEIHEHKSIILNTNLEFSRWVNILYDEQMTAALVGRLMHHCHLILFPGENNRLRESSMQTLYQSMTDQQHQEE